MGQRAKPLLTNPALLRAMADKLVPGIPHSTRISILQQTDTSDREGSEKNTAETQDKTVLQYVMSSDNHRNEVIRNMNGMLPILGDSYKNADRPGLKSYPRASRQRILWSRSLLSVEYAMSERKSSSS